ncbi:Lipopolysaccharide biosynthesis regulator YciM, contains six TPR domains and a predicted metal-binding C-terminal domain [Ectothiorhodospira mobilis]|uniref:Lipopolysaccharide assembly protein B n=1 Tax=Ectothiorhodospira mobilis TaxID=195064 RepID=A0A1I4PNJ2_ECTMO|nr:lipopolysaccharide assembly protein LapB [Ectothiorhodospira mobilis]SFM29176.1 Lipopolysaccharide biosynthesis regulator YciM, contains six TPR domains and a predicted metal-binding C-terminal domain [Ectothiorhodospira mobilis]
MWQLLWLLLPVAAASGWMAARRTCRNESGQERGAVFSADYIKGLNYLLNEQSDRALEVFLEMVNVDPETVETHLILGSLFRRRGEVDRAIRIHQHLVDHHRLVPAQRANAILELGRDYMKAGVLDKAEQLFSELIQLGYLQAEAYQWLRGIYERERDWAQAIWASERLCEFSSEPQNQRIAHYHCELGEAARARGDRQEAAHRARKALSFDHDCTRASILLGDLAREEGQPRLAIEHYERVLRQDAAFIPLILPRAGEAFQALRDTDGHEAFLRSVRRHDGTVCSAVALARFLNERDRRQPLEELLGEEIQGERIGLGLVLEYLRIKLGRGEAGEAGVTGVAIRALERHLEERPLYGCVRCGFQSRSHFWHCPGCHGWSTVRPLDRVPERRPETSLTPPGEPDPSHR